ncbi:MAG: hypothetical protein EPO51_08395 [Phenylobacterium sp.]|uniref:hypothetical protein n=1 Tax=Phenylobacterium sp. TaxID=1871053 RepID=UPI0011F5DAC0|nr:hypothetical protein [Phenylobacterium sp.]TAJ72126.1 MAG: hypothetical protein EPO51_08395 [Phenylobacterium sp.]
MVAVTPPIEGESLLSLIVRHVELNLLSRPGEVLEEVDIRTATPGFMPFTMRDSTADLARALGCREDEILSRIYRQPTDSRHEAVNFHGALLERRFLEAKVRRVSPQALGVSPHHRAAWMVRALSFCPESGELLIEACQACGCTLGWTRCSAVWRCDRCGFDLRRSTTQVPSRKETAEAIAAARLVDVRSDIRAAELACLPAAFRSWDPGQAFAAIVEFGLASSTSSDARAARNQAVGAGDFSSFTIADLAKGRRFALDWPESLAELAREEYARTGSTSVRRCFGTLSKYFYASTPPSPLRDLIRDAAAAALHEARVPAKLAAAVVKGGSTRTRTISALEVERLGISRRELRRLEGKSSTFVARQTGKGGTTLYDLEAITGLKADLEGSVSLQEAARRLALPAYAFEAILAAKLLCPVSNPDVAVVAAEVRVTQESLNGIIGALEAAPRKDVDCVGLVDGCRRQFHPALWAMILAALLSGRLPISRRNRAGKGVFDSLRVARAPLAELLGELARQPIAPNVWASCRTIAAVFGVPEQVVSAAVRAGLIEGDLLVRTSRVSLASAGAFDRKFVMSDEASELLGCAKPKIWGELTSRGLRPVASVCRHSLWDRQALERLLNS